MVRVYRAAFDAAVISESPPASATPDGDHRSGRLRRAQRVRGPERTSSLTVVNRAAAAPLTTLAWRSTRSRRSRSFASGSSTPGTSSRRHPTARPRMVAALSRPRRHRTRSVLPGRTHCQVNGRSDAAKPACTSHIMRRSGCDVGRRASRRRCGDPRRRMDAVMFHGEDEKRGTRSVDRSRLVADRVSGDDVVGLP